MSKITTLIRRSPFNTSLVSEALRMSLGLTLARNEVTILLVEDGVYLLASSDGEAAGYADVKRHLKTLKELHCEVVAEREALEKRDVSSDNAAVAVKGHREIAHMMEQSDRVIAF